MTAGAAGEAEGAAEAWAGAAEDPGAAVGQGGGEGEDRADLRGDEMDAWAAANEWKLPYAVLQVLVLDVVEVVCREKFQ